MSERNIRWRRWAALVITWATLACFALQAPALAQEEGPEPDHELARQALQRKEILPLDQVLNAIRNRVPGEIVEIELEREQGRWIYEVEIIDETGRMRDVLVDAKNAEIIGTEEDD
jgi:uncharacterized membrane protein YkoI